MPFITATVAALGVAGTISAGAAVGGLAVSAYSASKQGEASNEAAAASQRQEDIRQEQARLQAIREERKIYQEAQKARATINSNLAAQGASYSSAAEGALSSVGSSANVKLNALDQNLALGEQMFDANRQYASARQEVQDYAAVGDLGKTLFSASEKIGSIGSTLIGPKARS